jgi:phage portal protein BeeE
MEARTRTFSAIVCSLVTFISTSLATMSCHAADRPNSFAETGQLRELVNRPDCWTCENIDDLRRCEIADR